MAEKLPENPEIEPLTRTQVLVAMGVTAIILLVIAKLWLQFGSVTLLPVKWIGSDLLKGFAIGLAITAGSTMVYRLWPGYRRSADIYLEVVLKPLFWPDLIWLGLLPGLSEELLFRGVMLSAWGLNVTGLIVSSFCFGILHLGGMQQWPYAVWATAVGLLLGYSVLDTGNLLVPIVAHVCTNLISSCVWKWENNAAKQ
ncbi:MAG: CPBP family intramembrane metalloprotease [Oscillatoriaceae cyanobacterium Prado104]|nr:CPBP family intramembrane metalloprotease [Oscillatoriaceae cyanobacterium Prado104]